MKSKTVVMRSIAALAIGAVLTTGLGGPATGAGSCVELHPDPLMIECIGLTDLSSLDRYDKLTWLKITDSAVSDFSPLAAQDSLSHLTVGGSASDALLDVAPQLDGLRSLELGQGHGSFEALANADQITTLMVDQPGGVPDLSPIAGMSSLKDLTIKGTGSTDLAPLAGSTTLQKLSIQGGDGLNLSPLAALSGLTRLHVDFVLPDGLTKIPVGKSIELPRFTGVGGTPLGYETFTGASSVTIDDTKLTGLAATGEDVYPVLTGVSLPSHQSSVEFSFSVTGWPSYLVTTPVIYRDQYQWSVPKTAVPGDWAYFYLGVNGTADGADHQWLRNGAPIKGAISNAYKLSTADIGKKLQVRVTIGSHKPQITPVTRTYSAPTTVINRFTSVPAPKVAGTTRVGSALTASKPSTKPAAATAVSYQWYRNGSAIPTATRSNYTVTASDRSKRITVRAKVARNGYATVWSGHSARTGMIGYGLFTLKKYPVVTGTVRIGRTIKASPGSWTGSPTKYTYQWHRNGVPIAGAIKASHKVSSRDMGRVLSVKVTAHKAGYVSKTASSRVH